jgi:hypothetical protein
MKSYAKDYKFENAGEARKFNVRMKMQKRPLSFKDQCYTIAIVASAGIH